MSHESETTWDEGSCRFQNAETPFSGGNLTLTRRGQDAGKQLWVTSTPPPPMSHFYQLFEKSAFFSQATVYWDHSYALWYGIHCFFSEFFCHRWGLNTVPIHRFSMKLTTALIHRNERYLIKTCGHAFLIKIFSSTHSVSTLGRPFLTLFSFFEPFL